MGGKCISYFKLYAFRVIYGTNRYVYTAIDGLAFIAETVDTSCWVRTEIYNNSSVLRTANMPYR